jgi:hypothetical protein
LFMGVILGFLAQGMYDILKIDYSTVYPLINASWDVILTIIPIMYAFILAWKMRDIIVLFRQRKSLFTGAWKAVFYISFAELLFCLFISKVAPNTLFVDVLVVVLVSTSLVSFLVTFMQITLPLVESQPPPNYVTMLTNIQN